MVEKIIDRIRVVVFIKVFHDVIMYIAPDKAPARRGLCFFLNERAELFSLLYIEICRPACARFLLKSFQSFFKKCLDQFVYTSSTDFEVFSNLSVLVTFFEVGKC